MGKITAAVMVMLAGLFLAGCDKTISRQKPAGPGISAIGDPGNTNLVSRDLGALMLTNNYETSVALGSGKHCILTPKLIDSHNVQLTVTVESRNTKGKIQDLSITQVITRLGKPFEVAVGSFSFSLTPNLAAE